MLQKRPFDHSCNELHRTCIRRGNSYEFWKVIPPRARPAFGAIVTYSRSFGDVSRREAEHLAAECRKYCDRLIAEASNHPDPTARIASFRVAGRVPDREEIDRAVRDWLLAQEAQAAGSPVDWGHGQTAGQGTRPHRRNYTCPPA